jgi:transposase
MALNRKNALFAGSDGGGVNWATIATLIETCKLCGIDPQPYLAGTLTHIVNGHLNSEIDDLLPRAYPKAEPVRDAA